MNGLLIAILIVAVSSLVLLSVLVFEKAMRQGDRSRLYLVVFLLVSALYFASHGLYCCTPSPWSEIGGAFKVPLILSFIPLMFLFLRDLITGTTQKFKFVVKHLIFPALFIISTPLLIIFPQFNIHFDNSNSGYSLVYLLGHLVLISQIVIYTLRMFLRYSSYSGKLQDYYEGGKLNIVKIRHVLIAFVIYIIVLDNWLMSFLIPADIFVVAYPLILFIVAFATGWAGYTTPSFQSHGITADSVTKQVSGNFVKQTAVDPAIQQPKQVIASAPLQETFDIAKEETQSSTESRTPFDEVKKRELYDHLTSYLKESEAFTNPKLSLKQLATDLGTNTRYLSMVINEFENCNFNQMINKYRVNKVIQLLVENQAESYSYLGLAQKAGFHSKSVFISAFKSQTGSTPSEFAGSMKKLIQM